jgi:hypothetical protein
VDAGHKMKAAGNFSFFLNHDIHAEDFRSNDRQRRLRALKRFALLDDTDIFSTIKEWTTHDDPVIAMLADMVVNRKLLKIKISQHPFGDGQINELKQKVMSRTGIAEACIDYFVSVGEMTNKAYQPDQEAILILFKNGKLKDIRDASDINLEGLTKTVRKHFICYPAKISLGN